MAVSIHSIYVGQPRALTDQDGEWVSSIYRSLVDGPVRLHLTGLEGDRNAQPYHGTPELAVSCHALEHYEFWNRAYGLNLGPGAVGENWTLANADENLLCVGDIYEVGTARVQISAPRSPCETQARRIGRRDWVTLTLKELRTGLYMRVLTPGIVQAGDAWRLERRFNPIGTIRALNQCWYHNFDRALAEEASHMPGLMEWWQKRFAERLRRAEQVISD